MKTFRQSLKQYKKRKYPELSKHLVKKEVSSKILDGLLIGLAIPAILTSPFGLYIIVRGTAKYAFRKYDFHREIKRLQKSQYISLKKTKKGFMVRLLKKGERRRDQDRIKRLKLEKQKPWDNKWRLIIFDIPEDQRAQRDMFRKKLKSLGLFNFQRSSFAFPYACSQEIRLLSDYFRVSEYTTYIETAYIDIDKELKRHFKLK